MTREQIRKDLESHEKNNDGTLNWVDEMRELVDLLWEYEDESEDILCLAGTANNDLYW